MKRFIIVFVLLFVVFGVVNAEPKLVTAHPSERCVIYQCDYMIDVRSHERNELCELLESSVLGNYPRSYNNNYTFDKYFNRLSYAYIYETLSGKKDWRVISYGCTVNDTTVDVIWNRVMCDVWDCREKPVLPDSERTEYWNSKPKDIIPVYCEVSDFHYTEPRHEVFAAANSSFIHDIITEAGGTNIFDDIVEAYVYAGEDLVIERAPEIIFLLKSGNITPEDIKNRKEWENIPAVKNNRIYVIDDVPQSFFDIVKSTMTKQIQEAIKEYKK